MFKSFKIFRTGTINYDTSNFNFTYDSLLSPTVSSISPTTALNGLLTISGTNFATIISKH